MVERRTCVLDSQPEPSTAKEKQPERNKMFEVEDRNGFPEGKTDTRRNPDNVQLRCSFVFSVLCYFPPRGDRGAEQEKGRDHANAIARRTCGRHTSVSPVTSRDKINQMPTPRPRRGE